jgi:single-stranded DNA-binding protein
MKEKHMADASIKIDGRIANDVRFNSVNGKSVANIKVLAGRSKKNDDGTWENITTTAYDVAFWNQHAELVNMFNPNKGDSVVVTGTVTGIDKFQGDKGELLSVKVSGDGLRVFPKQNNNNGSSFPAPAGFNAEHQQTQAQSDPWAASNNQAAPF